ncbi:uncharacterized protein [Nicotiana sylvestris]|uniref:uncharacterized protein n=1 Tax=Nicotiana sylvestris TaxID=4096 RepID=UPI00388C5CC0
MKEYTKFLKEYEDIFVWSYDYMTGLSTSIVAHKLPTDPTCPPVKQKLRMFKPDMSLKIKEEVTKKVKANVLRVVEYPIWLANIVPVPKKDGKKSIKGQALADHLAENPVDGEYEPLKTYFPDEEVSFIGDDIVESYDGFRMFFDGATNFKGVGIGAVLVSETGQHYPLSTKLRIIEAATLFWDCERVVFRFGDTEMTRLLEGIEGLAGLVWEIPGLLMPENRKGRGFLKMMGLKKNPELTCLKESYIPFDYLYERNLAEELKKLTSRIQGIEGRKGIEGLNYEDLFIQPDVELPEWYKSLKFEMFDGIGDPRVHLRTYCDKLVGVGKDKRIHMKLSMRSLIGDALSWYISQDPKKWSSWKPAPNVHNNPLPDHKGGGVHVIEIEDDWDPEGSISLIAEGDDPKKPIATLNPIIVQIQPSGDAEVNIFVPLEFEATSSAKTRAPIEVEFVSLVNVPTPFEVAVLPPKAHAPFGVRVDTPIPMEMSTMTPFHTKVSNRPPIIGTGPDNLGRKIHAKEYLVIDQLNKMPAQISILALLQNSEAHKNALLKVLSEAYVPSKITDGEMANMVGQVLESHKITFHEDELPPEGLGYNKALHITSFQQDDIVYGSEEEEALATVKDLFLEDNDMGCCVILEEEGDKGPSIQAELRKRFTKTEFQHIPRIQNEFVDALATLSSMIQYPEKNFFDPIQVKIHDQPAYCAHVEEEADGKPWYTGERRPFQQEQARSSSRSHI